MLPLLLLSRVSLAASAASFIFYGASRKSPSSGATAFSGALSRQLVFLLCVFVFLFFFVFLFQLFFVCCFSRILCVGCARFFIPPGRHFTPPREAVPTFLARFLSVPAHRVFFPRHRHTGRLGLFCSLTRIRG